VLDKLADQLGAEPIPEMILGYGAQVEAMVYAVLFEFDLTEAERQSWRSGQLRITPEYPQGHCPAEQAREA
jgi:hypothetical protein